MFKIDGWERLDEITMQKSLKDEKKYSYEKLRTSTLVNG